MLKMPSSFLLFFWCFLFLPFSSKELLRNSLTCYQLNQKFLQTLLTGSSGGCLMGKICPYQNINSVSFNTILESRGSTSGRNMNPVHLHCRSKEWEGGDHDSGPCHAPCGGLHAMGVAHASCLPGPVVCGFPCGLEKDPV